MKYKLYEIIGLNIALMKLKNKELKPKYTFELLMILKKIEPIIKSFEETKQNILKNKKNQKDLNALFNNEIEIEEIKISKNIINQFDKIDLETLSLLQKFIKEGE